MRTGSAQLQSGFTLLEILIVVVIIGILATFATLSIGNRALDDRMESESERIEQLFRLAEEEAEVKGLALGVRFTTSGYEFLAINDQGVWADYGPAGGVLHRRRLGDPFYAELHIDGRMVPPAQETQPGADPRDAKQPIQPQILLLPGGETTAFEFDLKAPGYRPYFHIEADALGRIRRERRWQS